MTSCNKRAEHTGELFPGFATPPCSPERPPVKRQKMTETTTLAGKNSTIQLETHMNINRGSAKPENKFSIENRKKVHWHSSVVDNEQHSTRWYTREPLIPAPRTRTWAREDKVYSEAPLSPPLGVTFATSRLNPLPIPSLRKSQSHSRMLKKLLEPETSGRQSSYLLQAPNELSTSHKAATRVPPQVPDVPLAYHQRPPSTPLLERLPTPDLPEISADTFCECCRHSNLYNSRPRSSDYARSKWELQYKMATLYMSQQKRS